MSHENSLPSNQEENHQVCQAFEGAPLLPSVGHKQSEGTNKSAKIVLPISLFAALAMAATAATTVFSYASLICKGPIHCKSDEEKTYAAVVAVATLIANVCGLLIISPLERLSRRSRVRGLTMWFLCRSMSVIMLALGGMCFPKSPLGRPTCYRIISDLVKCKSEV